MRQQPGRRHVYSNDMCIENRIFLGELSAPGAGLNKEKCINMLRQQVVPVVFLPSIRKILPEMICLQEMIPSPSDAE